MTDNAAKAVRILTLLDLTDLNDDTTDDDLRQLCARAVDPRGSVAAVCIWPRFVSLARTQLDGSGVRIATVANFPSGAEPIADVVATTKQALADGADEIDVVLPYRDVAAGDVAAAEALLDEVRRVVPQDDRHLLKVILETGELGTDDLIETAARLAIRCGANIIKTSTGKTATSATLAATEVMLRVIKEVDPRVGIKPSGGIRTMADAQAYLDQAERFLGPDWVSQRTFRFGASGLWTALIAAIDGDDASAAGDSSTASY